MPGRDPFAYALLRVVPDLERGEAMNAAVVLYCRAQKFLRVAVALDAERLRALAPDADIPAIERVLAGLARVAEGDPACGAIAALPIPERFGWLVAPSSTVVQPGPVHTGLCDDPEATLARLVGELVQLPGR